MHENLFFSEKEVVSLTELTRRELMYLKTITLVEPVIKKPIRYTHNQLIFLRILKLLKKYLSTQFIKEIIDGKLAFDYDFNRVGLIIIAGTGIVLIDKGKAVESFCDLELLPLSEEIFEEVITKESNINTILSNINLNSLKRVLMIPLYRVRKNLREKSEELDIYNYQKREKFGSTNLMPKNIA